MYGALLVAHQNVPDAGFGVQRIVQGQDRTARIAEDGIDTQVDQGLQHALRAVEPVWPGACGGVHSVSYGLFFRKCVKCSAFRITSIPSASHSCLPKPLPGTSSAPPPCTAKACSQRATSRPKPASLSIGVAASRRKRPTPCLLTGRKIPTIPSFFR